jgi:hypothetical protein
MAASMKMSGCHVATVSSTAITDTAMSPASWIRSTSSRFLANLARIPWMVWLPSRIASEKQTWRRIALGYLRSSMRILGNPCEYRCCAVADASSPAPRISTR